jgi:predicted transcriptional regulator
LHPNAYLEKVRNVSSGLGARTKILQMLDQNPSAISRLAKETSLTYNVVRHHLRLLEVEGIVHRKGGRPYCWVSTGLGQKRLVS